MKQSPSRAFLTSVHSTGHAAADGDVILLAIAADQCRDRAERDRLIEQALTTITSGGIIWVEVPGRWRSAVMSTLRRKGLDTGACTVRRSRGANEAHIALTARALRFAMDGGHLSGRWRWVSDMLRSSPFARGLVTRLLPGVGFAAFWPGTRPFGWIVDRVAPDDVDVVLITNWRGQQAPYLTFALGHGETLIAKRGGVECEAQISHETAMLKLLGPGLVDCGLEIPRLIDSQVAPNLSSLIETYVPGRSMAALIRGGHHRDLGAVAERLCEWLSCWNRRTLRQVEFTSDLAESLILTRVRALAPLMDRGLAYLDWLSSQTAKLIGSKVPLVAAHNDLTMANVLGDASGIRSVVDWEAASIDGLPLTDFRYAVCDAAATIRTEDRLAAFRACFVEDGEIRQELQQVEAPLRAIAGGPPEWLELCVHTGWLGHAANEQARPPTARIDRSFLAIANLLADSVLSH